MFHESWNRKDWCQLAAWTGSVWRYSGILRRSYELINGIEDEVLYCLGCSFTWVIVNDFCSVFHRDWLFQHLIASRHLQVQLRSHCSLNCGALLLYLHLWTAACLASPCWHPKACLASTKHSAPLSHSHQPPPQGLVMLGNVILSALDPFARNKKFIVSLRGT